MSEWKALDQQVREMGRSPNSERIVSMVQFQDRILVATEYHVFEVVGQELIEIKFGGASFPPLSASLLALVPRDHCGDYHAQGKNQS